MPALRSNLRAVLLTVVLVFALIIITVLIYQGDSPLLRSGLGVALLAVIVWTSTQLPKAERMSAWVTPTGPRRRFHQLRSHTVQLLAEIRRLNGIAEDEKRGFRDRRTAELEMEQIEARMRELLTGIRSAAGVESPEQSAASPPPGA